MNVYLIEARCGMYEPSFWTVSVWTEEAKAHAEAERLNGVASAYITARRELGDGPDTGIPDGQWEPLFEAWDAKVRSLSDAARAKGDPQLDMHDDTTYSVVPVPFRGEATQIITEDPLFYYIHTSPGTVHCQRKQPLRASDDPLNLYEETIIFMCRAMIRATSAREGSDG